MNVSPGSALPQQLPLPPLLRQQTSQSYQDVHSNDNRSLGQYGSSPTGFDGSSPAEPPGRYQNDFVIQSQSLQAIDPFNPSLPPLNTFGGTNHQLLPPHISEFSFAPTPQNGHQFDVVHPARPLPSQSIHEFPGSDPFNGLQGDPALPDDPPIKNDSHLEGLKLIPHPRELDAWREKLFHIEEPITLTEEEFQTYWPHVDNVYSHRSTQKYKRKPFISHYWDCRLKGRPPGTPKSNDPNKKKRKRTARERDLCDVKIKITEYLPGAIGEDGQDSQAASFNGASFGSISSDGPLSSQQTWSLPSMAPAEPLPPPSSGGGKFYTIQRVNGYVGDGKTEGAPEVHRHTLDDSDRVKKNSVARWMLKKEKENKKNNTHIYISSAPYSSSATKMSNNVDENGKKTYHKKASGKALETVKKHSKEHDLKLFGSCFCPFVQRVWISLEVKQIPYQYIEVDPYKKPQSLLEVNPRGLVPALRHGDWACHESTVLMEYPPPALQLEDLDTGPALLPTSPQTRAHSRLWADHINRHFIPSFYRLLQSQSSDDQSALATELHTALHELIDAADPSGPFFLGEQISFVDIQAAPWILRLGRVLKPYRGWPDPEPGTRWWRWVEALETEVPVGRTMSEDELYLDSYERYAGE
ncbi:MAG: hypothetical protein Q9165_003437 [Trypethelium subeluteriae]